MNRALVVAAAILTGCMVDASPTVDDGSELSTCDQRALRGCREAGDACTWCAPVGESCNASVTRFCDGGLGWCTANVCRTFCEVTAFPRCADGTVESHERYDNGDVCTCVPG